MLITVLPLQVKQRKHSQAALHILVEVQQQYMAAKLILLTAVKSDQDLAHHRTLRDSHFW